MDGWPLNMTFSYQSGLGLSSEQRRRFPIKWIEIKIKNRMHNRYGFLHIDLGQFGQCVLAVSAAQHFQFVGECGANLLKECVDD